MQSGRNVVIAVCGGIAVLGLVVRLWRSDVEAPSSGEREDRSARRRVADERGASTEPSASRARGASGAGTETTARGSGASASRRADESTRFAPDDSSPRRMAPAIGTERKRARGHTEHFASAHNDVERRAALPDRGVPSLESERERPELAPADPDAVTGAKEPEAQLTAEADPGVAYDGGAEHVFDTATRTEVPDVGKISGHAGTIAFWIEPGWESNNADNATLVQLGEKGLHIVKDGDQLHFGYTDSEGNEQGGSADIADWADGDRRSIIATWAGRRLALYVDGGQIFLNTSQRPPILGAHPKLYVGSTPVDGAPVAQGQLSYLTILNREAPPNEVMQMYASGGAPQQ